MAALLLLFGALSLTAVAIGCVVASAHGAPASLWLRNLAAWAIGGLAALAIAKAAGARTAIGFLFAAPLVLVAGLLSAGQEGVHRWVDLGPVHMNVAAVLLPPAVVACAALVGRFRWAWGVEGLAAGLLITQPDASQATAFGGALIVIAVLSPLGAVLRLGVAALAILAAGAAWLRPDPLAPVPTVEGVMGLARDLSPLAWILAWTALGGATLAPLAASRAGDPAVRAAAVGLAAYAVLSAVTPLIGAFPVPLVGMGMSPVLGLWLGVGLLGALSRRPDALTFDPLHAPFRAS
jgi:cell division protein FtsW (lipid II flippase)